MPHVASKMMSCRMSNLRNALCRVTIFSGHVDIKALYHMSILRNGHVGLLNLGVKGHITSGNVITVLAHDGPGGLCESNWRVIEIQG